MKLRPARIVALLFTLLLFLRTGDERIAGVMDLISVDHLREHVRNIHFDRSLPDRVEALEQAARYMEQELLKSGLTVRREPVQWEGRWYDNVVAEKRGTTFPNRTLLVGAHYDTVPGSPGADDNASGAAVLLEVAKALQTATVETSVRVIAFALEEYGYVGSAHHAKKARQEAEEIIGMISLEMVGFTGPEQRYPNYIDPKFFPNVGDFIGVIGNRKSEKLLEGVKRALKTSVPNLPAEFLLVPGNGEGMEEMRLSDHSPFWDRGYPALMVTDTAFLRNPNYHLPTDTVETLDFEFMRKVAVGIYYSVVDLANSHKPL